MTIREVYAKTKEQLIKAGVDNPSFDALCLIEYVFGYDRILLNTSGSNEVKDESVIQLDFFLSQRIGGMPIQYIVGSWPFMGNSYKIGQGVLIPRDDTQVVVCACLDFLSGKKEKRVIDLCSGSGIIAVTIKKKYEDACVSAVEKSEQAFEYLQRNCKKNNADICLFNEDINACHKSFDKASFDLIVSNPPYVKTDDIGTLQKEISFEPKMALDGGADGYDFYRIIIDKWSEKLVSGGMLALELGENQFDKVCAMMRRHGFSDIRAYEDLGHIKRAVTGIYSR